MVGEAGTVVLALVLALDGVMADGAMEAGDTLVTDGEDITQDTVTQVMVGVIQVMDTLVMVITAADTLHIVLLVEEVTIQEDITGHNLEDEVHTITLQIQEDEVLMLQIIAQGIQLTEIAVQEEAL